jgi:hypothetical protein
MSDEEHPIHLSGGDARDGDIILRTRRRRRIFVGGLIGLVVLALGFYFAAW